MLPRQIRHDPLHHLLAAGRNVDCYAAGAGVDGLKRCNAVVSFQDKTKKTDGLALDAKVPGRRDGLLQYRGGCFHYTRKHNI